MAGLGFEETELRLGLPGGNDDTGDAAAVRKRGFGETIDLKLKLEQPAAHVDEDEAGAGDVVAIVPAAIPLSSSSPPAATTGGAGAGTTMKRPPTQSSVVIADAAPDTEKPRAPKAQAVGWPPVRSFRNNILAVHQSSQRGGDGKSSLAAAPPAFVKVSMDGAPYLRKVDLRTYGSYKELSKALQKMFSSFTIGSCGSQQGTMNDETKLAGGSDEYVPTYEDKDGDWMLVGDVPWEMFVESCKRLRIMKGSEAVGLAPRAMDKVQQYSCR